MRIVQLLPSLVRGDAIGNDAICIDKLLKREGYETCLYADYLGNGVDNSLASKAGDLSQIREGEEKKRLS